MLWTTLRREGNLVKAAEGGGNTEDVGRGILKSSSLMIFKQLEG